MNFVTLKDTCEVENPFEVPYFRLINFEERKEFHFFYVQYGLQFLEIYHSKNDGHFFLNFDPSKVLGSRSWAKQLGGKVRFKSLFKNSLILYRKYLIERMHEDFVGQCNRLFAEKPVRICPIFYRGSELESAVLMGLEFESCNTTSTSNPKAVFGYDFEKGCYLSRVGFKGRKWTEDSDTYSTALGGAGMALNQIFYGYF